MNSKFEKARVMTNSILAMKSAGDVATRPQISLPISSKRQCFFARPCYAFSVAADMVVHMIEGHPIENGRRRADVRIGGVRR